MAGRYTYHCPPAHQSRLPQLIEYLHLFVLGDETRPPDNVHATFVDVLLFRATYASRGDVNEVVGQNVRELIRVTAQVSCPTRRLETQYQWGDGVDSSAQQSKR